MGILFKSELEEVEIVIQIANFHHRRIKLNEVLFGISDQIIHTTYKAMIIESIFFGSLLIISLYYAVLFFIQRRDWALIYLSLISLVVGLRGSVMGERILLRLAPYLSGEIMMKIGYLPVFVVLPLLILYVSEIFKSSRLDNIVVISKKVAFLSLGIIVMTSVKTYDWLFEYGSGGIILGAIYVIYVVGINGFIKNTRGSSAMVIGGVVILVAAFSDVLRDLGIINVPELLSAGVIVFVILQAAFLAWRLNAVYEKTTKLAEENVGMYEEIRVLNKELENKVKARTEELERVNKRLEQLSKTDSLTGLYNRRYFDENFKKRWCESLKKQLPLSIIMIDIDCFKGFNDYYGHLEGDECLRKVADILKRSVRPEVDIAARYGGEEFVLLLPDTDKLAVRQIAENIRKDVEALRIRHKLSTVSHYVTISLGINTLIVSEEDDQEEFVNQADKALYLAKETGKNCIRYIGRG